MRKLNSMNKNFEKLRYVMVMNICHLVLKHYCKDMGNYFFNVWELCISISCYILNLLLLKVPTISVEVFSRFSMNTIQLKIITE